MFKTEADLKSVLAMPSDDLVADFAATTGDIVILGAGGKMGPTLAVLARRALVSAGRANDEVYAVSRYSDSASRGDLEAAGVRTIAVDLLEDDQLGALPDAKNVIFMVGVKFGAAANPSLAWEINTALPDRVARRYSSSAIVAMSTGNVYAFVAAGSGGAVETDELAPVGEYAMSCLGRERVFEFGARTRGTQIGLVRLNYAIDLRYGVLADIGSAVLSGAPVSLAAGNVNVVWQGYANEVVLRSLGHASREVFTLNVTGPETLSIRRLASRLGKLLARKVEYVDTPAETSLLANAGRCFDLFGYPTVTTGSMVEWQADWLKRGMPTLGKPTKWANRDGTF